MFALKEKIFSLFHFLSRLRFSPKHKFLLLTFLMPKKLRLLWAFLFLAVLWPFRSASALCFDANCIASAVFKFLFMIIVSIGNLILQFAFLLLNWVLSENFMPWSYTTPTGNPIIEIGWTLTRDLANMSFVVILVAIGLGTALKLKEYDAQKLIPRLIIIALLINFTPVILGLMLDAANITMNFFLEKISGFDALVRITESQAKMIGDTIMKNDAILGIIAAAFQAMVLFIIDILSAAIIVAFTALFVMRYVMIWLLVILSPIAFASRILPQTQGMIWKRWWNEFVQWTIIGIPAAFFLYLGNFIMAKAPSMTLSAPGGSGIFAQTFTNFITSIMPYLIAVMFLYIGFFMALSSSATGADGVIKTVKSGVSKSRNWAQTRGKRFASRKLAESDRFKRMSERLSTMQDIKRPSWGTKIDPVTGARVSQSGIGGWAKRRAAAVAGAPLIPLKVPGVKQATAELGRRAGRAGMGLTESAKKEIDRAEKELEKASVEMVISKFRSTTDWATKIGYLNRLVKKGDLDEALKKGLKSVDVAQTLIKAEKYGEGKDIISAMPTVKEDEFRTRLGIPVGTASAPPSPLTPLQTSQMANLYRTEVISKIRPDRAGQISRESLQKPEVVEAMILQWDGRYIGKLMETHGRDAADAIEKRITDLAAAAGVTPKEWLEGIPAQPAQPARPHPTVAGVMLPPTPAIPAIPGANPKLAAYIKSSAGRQFFTINLT